LRRGHDRGFLGFQVLAKIVGKHLAVDPEESVFVGSEGGCAGRSYGTAGRQDGQAFSGFGGEAGDVNESDEVVATMGSLWRFDLI
jgi:hypothetical protein